MIHQMRPECLLLLTSNGRLPAAPMNLGFERAQCSVLTHQLPHQRLTDRKSLAQFFVTPFAIFVSGHNPLTQIQR